MAALFVALVYTTGFLHCPGNLHHASVGPHATRAFHPRATAAEEADAALVKATEALKSGDLAAAQQLVTRARAAYEPGSERLALADMIQSRIDAPREEAGGEATRLSSAGVEAAARKAASHAVAARLAARAGPVAWNPRPESPQQQAAMKEGDDALSRTVAALSAKQFIDAHEVRTLGCDSLPLAR